MIKGNIVYLRALEPSDIDLLFEWENNVDIWRISDTIQPFSRFNLEKYVNSTHDIYAQHQLRWMICENDTSQAIGCIDLFDFNPIHHRVGLGILIAEEGNRKRGYARESLNLVVEYSFSVLDCHQVYCNILEDNFRSINLFEKAGFQRIGLKHDWIRQGKEYKNEYTYQLIRGE